MQCLSPKTAARETGRPFNFPQMNFPSLQQNCHLCKLSKRKLSCLSTSLKKQLIIWNALVYRGNDNLGMSAEFSYCWYFALLVSASDRLNSCLEFLGSFLRCHFFRETVGGIGGCCVRLPAHTRSLYVSGKLPTYPSPTLTSVLTSHLGENVSLGEG